MGVAKLTDQNTVVPAESKYARVERERRYLLQDLPEGLTRASAHVHAAAAQENSRAANEQVDRQVDAEVCPRQQRFLANAHHQHLSQRVGSGNARGLRCKRDS